MRIVLDTNVLISGMINPRGAPGRIVELLLAGAVELVVDDRILPEYVHVLRRRRFRRCFSSGAMEETVIFLRDECVRTRCTAVVDELPDAGDIAFLEAAISEHVPLVTGNERDFPVEKRRGCEILSPREFLTRYGADSGSARPPT